MWIWDEIKELLKIALAIAALIFGLAAITGHIDFDWIAIIMLLLITHPFHLLAFSATIFLVWLMIRTGRRRY